MRLVSLIILLILSFSVCADEVKIEITPPKPVAGEVFQAMFRIFTDSDSEPVINFSSTELDVVGKSNQGVSTRTVYANGSLTVTREFMIVYDLVANKPGTFYLRDIDVKVGEKTLKHPSVVLTVLKEAEEPTDVFVMADVPKKELFIGEGVIVRYYLYSRLPVNALDIKRYPKLNKFLKRFLQEPDRMERVSVNGELYLRSQIYAAKLFPEKTGDLKIDPLSLSATYPTSRGNDPFGAFGLNREFKTRTFNSEPVVIKVKPLPTPVPAHFTGLVGQHEFNLRVNQQKLIVNEPLEVSLSVTGPGALENLEAPTLIEHPDLEEFESTGDLKINDAQVATKTFEYTFLAKSDLQIPSSNFSLSYLDPSTGRYVIKELTIPEITVAGGGVRSGSKDRDNRVDPAPKNNPTPSQADKPLNLTGPLGASSIPWSKYLPIINFTLAGIALVLALGFFIKTRPANPFSTVNVPRTFKKGQFSFGEFAKWLSPVIQKTGKSPVQIIKDAELEEDARNYFLQLLHATDQKDYANRKLETKYEYRPKYFKRLARYIESVENESSSKSI